MWVLEDAPLLSAQAKSIVIERANCCFVSPVSAYEIAFKAQLGRLEPLEAPFAVIVNQLELRELHVEGGHAERAGQLPLMHRDPFDRLLAAQAMVEDLTVVTRDPAIAALGAPVAW